MTHYRQEMIEMTYHPPRNHNRRRAMRRQHAVHAHYCSCGKVVHGNGGKAGHGYMHARHADGHRWITSRTWDERFGS